MDNEMKRNIALLVDYDNFNQLEYFKILFEELDEMGELIISRVYFSNVDDKKMAEKFKSLELDPIYQLRFSTGKNAVDIRMAIEAIELLSKGYIDAFCLATHDSDFTPLVKKLKEHNKYIIGAGRDNVSEHFKKACDHFINVEQINNARKSLTNSAALASNKEREKITEDINKKLKTLIKLIDEIIDQNKENDGSIALGKLTSLLYLKDREFNPKNYGASSNKILPFFQKQLKDHYAFVEEKNVWKISKKSKYSVSVTVVKPQIDSKMKESATKIVWDYVKSTSTPNIQKIQQQIKKDIPSFTLKAIGHTKFVNFLKDLGYKVNNNTFSKPK